MTNLEPENITMTSQERLSPEELLSLVEWITGGAEELPEKQTNSDRLLLSIYRAVHSHRLNCCKNVHSDWREEAIEAYNQAKKEGEL